LIRSVSLDGYLHAERSTKIEDRFKGFVGRRQKQNYKRVPVS
jgi:hypothetical protein